MTDIDSDAITDLSQVRWSTRHHVVDNWAADVEPMGGWHVVGETSHDPDPHVREVYDLWVQNAHDGDGGDCSAWLADMVAGKLTESVDLPDPDLDDGPEGVGWVDDEWDVHLDVDGWLTVQPVNGYVQDPVKLARALLAAAARRDSRPAMREEGP